MLLVVVVVKGAQKRLVCATVRLGLGHEIRVRSRGPAHMGGCGSAAAAAPPLHDPSALPAAAAPPAEPPAGLGEADDGTSPIDTSSPAVMIGALHGRRVTEEAAGLRFAFEVDDDAHGWLVDCARGDAVVVTRYERTPPQGGSTAGAAAPAPTPTARAWFRSTATFRAIEADELQSLAAIMHGHLTVRGDLPKFAAIDGLWSEMKRSLGAPLGPTGGLLGTASDGAGISLAELERARNNVHVYYFFQTLAWGVFAELYSYYATYEICDDDSACSTAVATYNSILYGFGKFLANPVAGTISDRVGRRPVLLIGCLVDCCVFFAYGLLPCVAS